MVPIKIYICEVQYFFFRNSMQTNATLEHVKFTLFKKRRCEQSYLREDGSARAFAFYQRCRFSTSLEHLSQTRLCRTASGVWNIHLYSPDRGVSQLVKCESTSTKQSVPSRRMPFLALTQRPLLAWFSALRRRTILCSALF